MILSDRFDRAFSLASSLHRKQSRKSSGTPYVAHVLSVSALVIEDGGSEDEAIAALLHDSVEDQGTTYPGGPPMLMAHIDAEFGAEVARLVDVLTERPTVLLAPDASKSERWRAHRSAYIARIRTFDSSVRRISCADNLANVRSMIVGYRKIGDRLWRRFMTRAADDQLWAYSAISRAFVEGGADGLAAELEDAVDKLHYLAGIERD